MGTYGRFTLPDGNITGAGGIALANNFKAAEDTLSAVETGTSSISNVTTSISAQVQQLDSIADQLSASISGYAPQISSLSTSALSLSAALSSLSSGMLSLSSAQQTLSGMIESIVARLLPLRAIVMTYVSGGNKRYKAQYGDTHGLIADSNDATTVLNAALAYVAANGGRLHICSGTYQINSTISCSSSSYPIHISGSGPATILQCNNAAANPLIDLSNCASVTITDLTVDGNKLNVPATTTMVGLRLNGCVHNALGYCQFKYIPGHAVVLQGSTTHRCTFHVSGCRFYGMFGSGLYVNNDVQELIVTGSSFINNCTRYDLFSACSDIYVVPEESGVAVNRCIIAGNMFFGSGASWFDNAWNNRQLLLIHATEVKDYDFDMAHLIVKLYGSIYTNVNANSVRFTMADGVTPIAFERRYHPAGSNYLEYVLLYPKLYSGEVTPVYMYWNNQSAADASTQIWGPEYRGVWHMQESNGIIADSSQYGRNATNYGSTLYNTYPLTGRQFDGVDDYAVATGFGPSDIANGFSVIAVVKPTVAKKGVIVSINNGSRFHELRVSQSGSNIRFEFAVTFGTGSGISLVAVSDSFAVNNIYVVYGRAYQSGGEWYVEIFVNGARYQAGSIELTPFSDPGMSLYIGRRTAGSGDAFAGVISDVVLYRGKVDGARAILEWYSARMQGRVLPMYNNGIEYNAIEARIRNIGTAGNIWNTGAINVSDISSSAAVPGTAIAGNIFSGLGGSAVILSGTSRPTICGNNITNIGGSGVRIANSTRVNINGNAIRGCNQYGTYFGAGILCQPDAPSQDVSITVNQVIGSGGDGVVLGATRSTVADNQFDNNCVRGELRATVASKESNSITLTATGMPPGMTAQSSGMFLTGMSVQLVWYDIAQWYRSTGFTISSCTGNTIVLSGTPPAGLTVNSLVWLSVIARTADILVTGQYDLVHHNVIRVPSNQSPTYHYHASNMLTGTMIGNLLKFADNDLVVGSGDTNDFYAYLNITGSGNTVTNNRGQS